jgi:hypothetical protein
VVAATGAFGIVKAANNEPRFDHDPLTLACKGLLIEESRTNLVLQSENHPSASWNKTGVTVASASNTAPDGVATSNLVSEDISVGLHRIFQSTAYVSGTSYSISCFLKYAGRQFVAINHPTVAANGIAIFDIQNGTITLSQAGITSSITAYPNGWYRCVINGVSSTTGGSSHIIQGSTTGNSLTGSYTGLDGPAFYIYGSQVEAGAFPTSYIPTVASTVVRSADVCSITGSDFSGFWNRFAGTCVIGVGSSVAGGGRFISNNSGARALELFHNSGLTGIDFFEAAGVNEIRVITAPIFPVKLGLAYAINDYQSSANGILGGADTNTGGTIPDPNALHIGNLGGSAPRLTGHIQSVRYFKKRLSNAKLTQLTT